MSPALSFEYLKLKKYESLLSFITTLQAFIKETGCRIKHGLKVRYEKPNAL